MSRKHREGDNAMLTRHAIPLACAAAVVLGSLVTARAQTPAPVPEAMPFDIPYGAPIDLDTAQKAIAASMAEARKHNWKMAIAVVDPAGQLVALVTMDGTQYASIDIAQAKARTAAAFRRPSKAMVRCRQRRLARRAQPAGAGTCGRLRGRLSDRAERQAGRGHRRQRWYRNPGRRDGEGRAGRGDAALS